MTSQYTNTPNAAPVPARPKTAVKSPAPWVENGFMQLDRAFVLIVPELSATALRAYLVHLSNTHTQGATVNSSRQFRENAADKMGRDETTLDKGNVELAKRGMIAKSTKKRRCGAAQEWHLTPPSAWKFESLKNASLRAQKCVSKDAKTRSITKETEEESFRTNSAGAEIVVADSKESVFVPAAPVTEIEAALIAEKVPPRTAAELAENYAAPAIWQQIEWLDARNPSSRPATLIAAIRGAWGPPGAKPRDTAGAHSWQKPQSDVSNAPAREIYREAPARELPVEVEFDEADFEGEMFQGVAPESASLALIRANLRDGATFEELMRLRGFYEVGEWKALIERARIE